MNILMITGSAHKNGTTATLADQFIRGAEDALHKVHRFDAAFKDVHPCIACEKCHNSDTGCAFQDDMNTLNPMLLAAEAVVFVTPIYYYGMNAQIRTVIDRFYANDAALHGKKRTALMVALADDTPASAKGAVTSFELMADFLGWKTAGTVIAAGCMDVNALRKSKYLDEAYQLGKTLFSV